MLGMPLPYEVIIQTLYIVSPIQSHYPKPSPKKWLITYSCNYKGEYMVFLSSEMVLVFSHQNSIGFLPLDTITARKMSKVISRIASNCLPPNLAEPFNRWAKHRNEKSVVEMHLQVCATRWMNWSQIMWSKSEWFSPIVVGSFSHAPLWDIYIIDFLQLHNIFVKKKKKMVKSDIYNTI